MKPLFAYLLIATAAPMALAKLPAPDDAAKARAAEAAAKTAWQAKVDAYQLCKSQDKVAAPIRKSQGLAPLPAAACVDPGPFVYTPPDAAAPAAAVAPAPAAPAAAKKS